MSVIIIAATSNLNNLLDSQPESEILENINNDNITKLKKQEEILENIQAKEKQLIEETVLSQEKTPMINEIHDKTSQILDKVKEIEKLEKNIQRISLEIKNDQKKESIHEVILEDTNNENINTNENNDSEENTEEHLDELNDNVHELDKNFDESETLNESKTSNESDKECTNNENDQKILETNNTTYNKHMSKNAIAAYCLYCFFGCILFKIGDFIEDSTFAISLATTVVCFSLNCLRPNDESSLFFKKNKLNVEQENKIISDFQQKYIQEEKKLNVSPMLQNNDFNITNKDKLD